MSPKDVPPPLLERKRRNHGIPAFDLEGTSESMTEASISTMRKDRTLSYLFRGKVQAHA
jgi:hypothetical protein